MPQKTWIIGLTGQTGAGKTTIGRLFLDRGVAVINADHVAKEAMEGSKECLMDLVLEFSTDIIRSDATLNRARLAEICFSDKTKLRRLNAIVFPHILKAIEERISAAQKEGADMVVLDAPTLYESGLDKRCDRVIAVIADEHLRMRRIMTRDEMTEEEAQRRIGAQGNEAFYTERADDILTNNEDLDALRLAFFELYSKYEHLDDAEIRAPRSNAQAQEADSEPYDSGQFLELEHGE